MSWNPFAKQKGSAAAPSVVTAEQPAAQVQDPISALLDSISKYKTNQADNSAESKEIVRYVTCILLHELPSNVTGFQAVSQVVKSLPASIQQVKTTYESIQNQAYLDNPDYSFISGPDQQAQAIIIESFVRFLLSKNIIIQFFKEVKLIIKSFEKMYQPSSIMRNADKLTQIANKLQESNLEMKIFYHSSLSGQNKYEEVIQKIRDQLANIPKDKQLFSYDQVFNELIHLTQNLFQVDDLQNEVKALLDLQQALDNIVKDKVAIHPDILLLSPITKEIIVQQNQNIEFCINILQQAGAKLKTMQKPSQTSFGATQQRLLFYRLLISQPTLFSLLFAGMAGLLEEKPQIHMNLQKVYKSDTPIKNSKFCGQMCQLLFQNLMNIKLFNVHSLAPIALQCQYSLLSSCLSNNDDGYLIINYKIFRLHKAAQQEFNIVYYFQLAEILINLFDQVKKNYLKSNLLQSSQGELSGALQSIQQELNSQQLCEEEYIYSTLFKLLQKGILHQLFRQVNIVANQQFYLCSKDSREYLFRQVNQLQQIWSKKIQKTDDFYQAQNLQKERMCISSLLLMQESDSIKNSGLDIVDGSFIGKVFEGIENNMNQFCQMLPQQIKDLLKDDLCKQYQYHYDTNAIEYKQVYEDEIPKALLDTIEDLKTISSTKQYTASQMQRFQATMHSFLTIGAAQPIWDTLQKIVTKESSEQLFEIISSSQLQPTEEQKNSHFIASLLNKNGLQYFPLLIKSCRNLLKHRYDMDAWILSTKNLDYINAFCGQNSLEGLKLLEEKVVEQPKLVETKQVQQVQQVQSPENENKVTEEPVKPKESLFQEEQSDEKPEAPQPQQVVQQNKPQPQPEVVKIEPVKSEVKQEKPAEVKPVAKSVQKVEVLSDDAKRLVRDLKGGLEPSKSSSSNPFGDQDKSESENDPEIMHESTLKKNEGGDKDEGEEDEEGSGDGKKPLRNRKITNIELAPHQLISHLMNNLPFMNSYILLDQIDVQADIARREDLINSIITEAFVDSFVIPDQDKQDVTLKEVCKVDHSKDKQDPLKKATKKAKFSDENWWAEQQFQSKLQETLQTVLANNPDHDKPLHKMATFDEVIQGTMTCRTTCYNCGDPLDFSLMNRYEDAELSNDIEMYVKLQPLFCQFYAHWLCAKCAEGHGPFQMVQPNHLDGGIVPVSGIGLQMLYKFWNMRIVQPDQIQGKQKGLIMRAQVAKGIISNAQLIFEHCQLFMRQVIALNVAGTGELFERSYTLHEYFSLLFDNIVKQVWPEQAAAFSAIVSSKQIKALITKHSIVNLLAPIDMVNFLGNVADKQDNLLSMLLLHVTKCDACAKQFYVCPECKAPFEYQLGFEYLIQCIGDLSCKFCLRPLHKEGGCAREHKCLNLK